MKKIKARKKCDACGKPLSKWESWKVPGLKMDGRIPWVCKACIIEFGKPVDKQKPKEFVIDEIDDGTQ